MLNNKQKQKFLENKFNKKYFILKTIQKYRNYKYILFKYNF